jgi:O-antigen/teichoic acid export membrane protein
MREIIDSATFRQSVLTTGATLINGILGVAFYPLVARLTGVSDFGSFSISVLTMTLLSDIANFGTDTGIVRFVGKYFETDKSRAYKYLKFALKFKIIVGLCISLFGIVAAPAIAMYILKKPELIDSLRIAFFGSTSLLLLSFATSSIQSIQKFGTWSALNISLNTLRLLMVVILGLLGVFTIENALFIYALIPFLGFFIGILFLPQFWREKNENSVAKEFLHYNKWVGAFILLAALSSRLDSFLTTRFLPLESVGIYAAAVTLASVGPQVVAAIATVVAPKLASLNSKETLLSYLKKLQLFLLSLGFAAFIAGSLLSVLVIPTLFGDAFTASITPFIILALAQVIFLVSIPVHTTIIYYYAKPIVFVWVGIIHLLIIFFVGSFLIQKYGVTGAALSVLVGNISNFLVPAGWVMYKLKK